MEEDVEVEEAATVVEVEGEEEEDELEEIEEEVGPEIVEEEVKIGITIPEDKIILQRLPTTVRTITPVLRLKVLSKEVGALA